MEGPPYGFITQFCYGYTYNLRMIEKRTENRVAIFLNAGVFFTILAVTTFMSIEPVNTPKQVIIVMLGVACWAIIAFNIGIKKIFNQERFLTTFILFFVFLSILNIILSDAPAVQTFYGSFGRSTGALTYVALSGILLVYSSFSLNKSFQKLIVAIIAAGLLNLIYCAIDIVGPDLLGWNNTYGPILGTLGNPDFISAFLGISAVMLFPYAFKDNINIIQRIAIIIFQAVSFFEIFKSNAKQGMVVFGFGIIISIYLVIKTNTKISKFSAYFALLSIILGVVAFLGTLQIGPLTKYLYKTSVSLRGVYWETGISMGNSKPLSGIGFDSYGNYYREFRNAEAMILPGPSVVTNAAHNVAIDIYSAGGLPLLFSYIGIMGLGLIATIKIIKNMKKFDPLVVSLIVGWLGYQAQSLISINQIGLAICGWTLTGALIGYSRIDKSDLENISKTRMAKNDQRVTALTPMIIGSAIGLAIALPPFIADAGWRSALHRGDGAAIIKNATQWPKDTYRLTNIAFALEKSNLSDDALKIARENVRFNPRSYDAWKLLVQISKSTESEKLKGVEMMHKLDPLNTKLQ